jgi:hypothetical protein
MKWVRETEKCYGSQVTNVPLAKNPHKEIQLLCVGTPCKKELRGTGCLLNKQK